MSLSVISVILWLTGCGGRKSISFTPGGNYYTLQYTGSQLASPQGGNYYTLQYTTVHYSTIQWITSDPDSVSGSSLGVVWGWEQTGQLWGSEGQWEGHTIQPVWHSKVGVYNHLVIFEDILNPSHQIILYSYPLSPTNTCHWVSKNLMPWERL